MVAPPQRMSPKALQIRAAALNLPPLDARVGNSALAQLVEQLTVNQRVAGSSPAGGAKLKERLRALFFCARKGPGSTEGVQEATMDDAGFMGAIFA